MLTKSTLSEIFVIRQSDGARPTDSRSTDTTMLSFESKLLQVEVAIRLLYASYDMVVYGCHPLDG